MFLVWKVPKNIFLNRLKTSSINMYKYGILEHPWEKDAVRIWKAEDGNPLTWWSRNYPRVSDDMAKESPRNWALWQMGQSLGELAWGMAVNSDENHLLNGHPKNPFAAPWGEQENAISLCIIKLWCWERSHQEIFLADGFILSILLWFGAKSRFNVVSEIVYEELSGNLIRIQCGGDALDNFWGRSVHSKDVLETRRIWSRKRSRLSPPHIQIGKGAQPASVSLIDCRHDDRREPGWKIPDTTCGCDRDRIMGKLAGALSTSPCNTCCLPQK